MSFRYELFSILMETDIPLVALDACALEGNSASSTGLMIRRGYVPRSIDDGVGKPPIWSRNQNEFLLDTNRAGRFRVASGKSITYAAAGTVSAGQIEPYLLGSCMAAILHQRGMPVLHAASVVKHGGAFAISGPSGAGKSTTTTRLVSRGAQILSDDLTVFSNDPVTQVLRGYPQSKLKHDAFAALGSAEYQARNLPVETGKVGVDLRESFASAPAPLRAIFLLRPIEKSTPSVMQLEPSTALSALVPMVYRRIFLSKAEFAVILSFLTNIVARIPVFHIGRPTNADSTGFVVSAVEDVMKQYKPEEVVQ